MFLLKTGTERCGERMTDRRQDWEALVQENKGCLEMRGWTEGRVEEHGKRDVGACSTKPGPRTENSAAACRVCKEAGVEGEESALGGGACSKVGLTSLILRSRLCERQLFFSSLFHGINGLCGFTKFVQQSVNSEMEKRVAGESPGLPLLSSLLRVLLSS